MHQIQSFKDFSYNKEELSNKTIIFQERITKVNNIYNELIKNNIGFEIEEFKNVNYSNLVETQLLYKYGENFILKIFSSDNKKFIGTGFLIQIEQSFKLPFERGLFACNNIFPEGFLNNNEYLYFIHKNIKK